MLVQAIYCTPVKVSVESVIESLIIVYECHFYKLRPVRKNTTEAEMEIAVNCPTIA